MVTPGRAGAGSVISVVSFLLYASVKSSKICDRTHQYISCENIAGAAAFCQMIFTGLPKRSAGTFGSVSAWGCLGARCAAPLESILGFFPQLFRQVMQDLPSSQSGFGQSLCICSQSLFPTRMDFGLNKAHCGWKREASWKLCSSRGGWQGRELGRNYCLWAGVSQWGYPKPGCWRADRALSAGAARVTQIPACRHH